MEKSRIEIIRFAYTPLGTFGRLEMDEFECYTIERPWADNRPRVSCIPIGEYELMESFYNRGGYECYQIIGVPERTLIKIHVANTIKDVIGCIGLGDELGFMDDLWGVGNSKRTHSEFMGAVGGSSTTRIIIRDELKQVWI